MDDELERILKETAVALTGESWDTGKSTKNFNQDSCDPAEIRKENFPNRYPERYQ
jgi:hypothetical protein